MEPKGRGRRGGAQEEKKRRTVRVSCNDAACSLPAAPAMHLPPFILLRTFSRRDFPRNLTTPRTVFHQLFLLAHSCILSLPLRAAVRLVYCTHHHHPLFICLHMRFLTLPSLPSLVSLPFPFNFPSKNRGRTGDGGFDVWLYGTSRRIYNYNFRTSFRSRIKSNRGVPFARFNVPFLEVSNLFRLVFD